MEMFIEDGIEYTICESCGRQIRAALAEETDAGDVLCDDCFREIMGEDYDPLGLED